MTLESTAHSYCAECNKKIDFSYLRKSLYAWKRKNNYYCSHTCYSNALKKEEEEEK